ncbi:GntR family transcriptional regulator [Pseudokineococcus sp. 1T1Z-3]|uniref:GntR family transcriptional regulator n=1 Tax=Pseudokineococcus sp. 1T1Z-3 TaxID=3132745 RepID=UPI0030B32CC3
MSSLADASFDGLGRVERTTRRELILAKLRTALASGQFPQGTHMVETTLSEALGVSRGTLREALRHLQQEGLLVADSRGRLTVRVLSRHEVAGVFAVRGALEALAVEAVCALPDRGPAITELRGRLERLRQATSFADRVTCDLELHEALCRASGNESLVRAWLGVGGHARAAIVAAGEATALHNMAAERHEPLVAAIERGEVPHALETLRRHLDEAVTAVLSRMPEESESDEELAPLA